MFQVKRMVSNMLGGAIEVASNDSETITPALRIRSSAARGSPVRPSRNSDSVAKLAASWCAPSPRRRTSLAGM